MPRPLLGALVVGLAALAGLPAGDARAQSEPVAVYGIDLESSIDRARILVFAESPVEYELAPLESDPTTLVLSLPGTRLDDSAPRRVEPELGGPVTLVTAFERADITDDEVRIVIARAPGIEPEVTQRGSLISIEFLKAPEVKTGITLQFRDAELAEVVESVAAATGTRFIFDDKLKGRVTISVPQRVTPGEALELLRSALLIKGFGAVPTPGGPLKILAIDGVAASAPWSDAEPGDATDAPIATLVNLESADADRVAGELRSFTGVSSQVYAYAPTNSLILAGSEARLRRLLFLARALDAAAEETIVLRQLRHREADELANFLDDIYAERPALKGRFQVWPDTRTNRLIVRLPAGLREEVDERLADLDRPVLGRGRVEVVPVRYADPEALAGIVTELAGGGAAPAAAQQGAAPAIARGLAGRPFSITVDPPTHSLLLSGAPDTLLLVRELIEELDQVPPRVSIEAIIFQVAMDDSLTLGFDAFLPLTEPNSPDDTIFNILSNPSGGGLLNPSGSQPVAFASRVERSPIVLTVEDENGIPIELVIPRESFVVTADERVVASQVLQRPHLLASTGEDHEIFTGDDIPIPVGRTGATNPLQVQQNVERRDVGVTLRVRPTVGAAGGVNLELQVETSRLGADPAGAVEEVGPTIEQRRVETTVPLADSQWAVVGFAFEPFSMSFRRGTPWLMDLPWVGALARTTMERSMRRHLVVAVQAQIHRSGGELLAETVRRRLGLQRSVTRTREGLSEEDGPVALLIATRDTELEAQSIARSFTVSSRPPRISRWEWSGRERYDVYLTRYRSLAEAGAAAMPLVAEGWVPQVVVVPGGEPEPTSLHRPVSASVPPTSPP